jgi:hypothetical protein
LGKRGDALAVWAEGTGRRQVAGRERGVLRFVFYGRVSTEDHQDPVTSLAPGSGSRPPRSWPGMADRG